MCVVTKGFFYGEELLAPRPTPKLEDHPVSAVRDCLFNIFAATLLIGGRFSIRNPRTRHAVVTGTQVLIPSAPQPCFPNIISLSCFSTEILFSFSLNFCLLLTYFMTCVVYIVSLWWFWSLMKEVTCAVACVNCYPSICLGRSTWKLGQKLNMEPPGLKIANYPTTIRHLHFN